MTCRVFIPRDTSAVSVGADETAAALARLAAGRGLDLEIVRTGSRGLFWLEPLVEVETPGGRIAWGPVTAEDWAGLLDAGFPEAVAHPLCLGPVDALPALAMQDRVTFARCGVVDPVSLADYRAHGGYAGLDRAVAMTPEQIVEAVEASGLRGRGGAGFPTGTKWRTVLGAPGETKYIVCNADEGDSGTFADRMLMEGDPFVLIEGMTIAGLAVGAARGYVYIRSEYPAAIEVMEAAIAAAYAGGMLGASVDGGGRSFDLEVRVGAGAYICGEETALLESLEGRRGTIRYKPPLPALEGLFGKPTVVNNVLSLATVPAILAHGPQAHHARGVGRSRGTLTIQLCGNVAKPGLYELPFGLTLRTLVDEIGGGTASARPVRAVQVGGPLGAYFPATMLDLPLDYEAVAAAHGLLGHGGVVVFDDTVDMAAQARFAMEFCAAESCGKCTPCRVGAVRGVEVIDRILAGRDRERNLAVLDDLCELMTDASLCALGGLTPLPVRSALTHFPEDFARAPAAGAAA